MHEANCEGDGHIPKQYKLVERIPDVSNVQTREVARKLGDFYYAGAEEDAQE